MRNILTILWQQVEMMGLLHDRLVEIRELLRKIEAKQ